MSCSISSRLPAGSSADWLVDRLLRCHFPGGCAEPTPEVASIVLLHKLRVCGVVDTAGDVTFSLLLGISFDEWPALLQGIMGMKTVVEDHVSKQITK